MRFLLTCILIVLFVSCNDRSPYPGYSKGEKGIYYQLNKIGESTLKPEINDYITADIVYKTMNDSVFFTGRRKLQIQNSVTEGSIVDCFMMLSQGESASFIISADAFFRETLQTEAPLFIPSGSMMKVNLDIIEIQTTQQYEKEKEAFLNWIEDFGDYEKVVLQQFLKEEKLSVKPTGSGLFYLKLREGNGKKIVAGDTLTLNYEGRFLNGKFFDSTIKRKQPFQFVYGTEWQVVKGLEEAIGMMSEGEKSLFILPSDLAFGNEGSSTGIVPPFTSLLFEVEIISIN
jgi:FKBP-type peptidyl-prolyl cis-trans isomerase FkpA